MFIVASETAFSIIEIYIYDRRIPGHVEKNVETFVRSATPSKG